PTSPHRATSQATITCRRGSRSAYDASNGPPTTHGTNATAYAAAASTAEWVWSYTRNASATLVSWSPSCDSRLAVNRCRYDRTEKTSRYVAARAFTGASGGTAADPAGPGGATTGLVGPAALAFADVLGPDPGSISGRSESRSLE